MSLRSHWRGLQTWAFAESAPEHIVHDATLKIVFHFERRVQAGQKRYGFFAAISSGDGAHDLLPWRARRLDTRHVDDFAAIQSQRLARRAIHEFKWYDPHAEQVGAVNPLE